VGYTTATIFAASCASGVVRAAWRSAKGVVGAEIRACDEAGACRGLSARKLREVLTTQITRRSGVTPFR
jgi:hypothetical protein